MRRIAGLGFRASAPLDALHDALARAAADSGSPDGRLDALATAADKAGAPALHALAKELSLPILAIAPETLASETTLTRSSPAARRHGPGSLAEAAALAAAGPGARLTGPRAVSADRTATAAIAERIRS